MRITEQHAGKRVRCTGCASIFRVPPSGAVNAAGPQRPPRADLDQDPDNPYRASSLAASAPGSRRSDGQRGAEGTPSDRPFRVVVKNDPEKRLKGVYQAQPVHGGLELRQGKNDPVFLSVDSATVEKNGVFLVVTEGRAVTLAAGQANLYLERFTPDLVAYLNGQRRDFAVAEYQIPGYLLVSAYAPFSFMAVGIQGGAIGGALGGGYGGALIALNLAIIRKERWSAASRLAATLGVTIAGALVLVALALIVFRFSPAKTTAAWGTPEDPDGDCRITVERSFATIDAPGTVHDFVPPPGKANAPRIVHTSHAGDFVVEVKLTGNDEISDPPARNSHIAFHGAGLFLSGESGEIVRLERASLVRGGRAFPYLLFEHRRPGAPQDEQDAQYTSGPLFLRLERQGTQLLGAYSADGVSWQQLRPKRMMSREVKIGVALVNTAAAPFSARFEQFKFEKR